VSTSWITNNFSWSKFSNINGHQSEIWIFGGYIVMELDKGIFICIK
jgi:hypothetical protein